MRALAAVSALLLVAACQAPPPPEPEFTDADRRAIADEIEGLTREMWELGRPEDADAFIAYYSSLAESYFVTDPGIMVAQNRILPTVQALRDFADPANWTRQSTNNFPETVRVAVLSPEIAVVVADGYWNVTNSEGQTGPNYGFTHTSVWAKEDVGWKTLHVHESWTNDPIESETEG